MPLDITHPIPRIAAIHDLSGIGRCSLTVIMPVLSAMGSQVCPIPTAVLSTHSGGFGPFSFADLTTNMHGIIDHWRSLQLTFDCIYSGFLGSGDQIDIVEDFIDAFSASHAVPSPLVVVDPVMGDQGRRYLTYTDEMQLKMRRLVKKADLITPNMTEACFLLQKPYTPFIKDADEGKDLLRRLQDLGPEKIVITGAVTANNTRCNLACSREEFHHLEYRHIPAHYPGTGDLFTSVLIGVLMKGKGLSEAVSTAAEHVWATVDVTHRCQTPEREGVLLERTLGLLMNR